MTLIECKRLSVGYDKKVVCKDINFKVEEGDYLCILGENGSGKSTLLKTILGLNKAVFGKVIFEKSLSKNKLGYLPQQNDLDPFITRQKKIKQTELLNFWDLKI